MLIIERLAFQKFCQTIFNDFYTSVFASVLILPVINNQHFVFCHFYLAAPVVVGNTDLIGNKKSVRRFLGCDSRICVIITSQKPKRQNKITARKFTNNYWFRLKLKWLITGKSQTSILHHCKQLAKLVPCRTHWLDSCKMPSKLAAKIICNRVEMLSSVCYQTTAVRYRTTP